MLAPRLPVLSEETSPDAQRLEWQRYWLVDPLDGTREFLKRNGEFTVNIALVSEHRAVLGVVYAPAIGDLYWGAIDAGAWTQRGAESAACDSRAPRATQSRASSAAAAIPDAKLAAYVAALGPHEWRVMGSSLKICLIACGEADVYPRFGPTSEWDTGAAQAILESAGGRMIDLAGQPLRYNTKAHLLNPHFSGVWRPAAGLARAYPTRLVDDNIETEIFRNVERLKQLRVEHQDLDQVISRLVHDPHVDQIMLRRLKKRKLMLKDMITQLESARIPDLNA